MGYEPLNLPHDKKYRIGKSEKTKQIQEARIQKKLKQEKYKVPEKYLSFADRIPKTYAENLVKLKLIQNEDIP